MCDVTGKDRLGCPAKARLRLYAHIGDVDAESGMPTDVTYHFELDVASARYHTHDTSALGSVSVVRRSDPFVENKFSELVCMQMHARLF